MFHVTSKIKPSRFVLSATVFAFVGCLAYPLRADLLVSQYSSGPVYRFDDTGKNPTTFSAGDEGVAGANRVVAGGCEVFVANNSAVITVYDGKGTFKRSTTIPGGVSVAALSFNADGSVLYAADYGANEIWALNPSNGSVLNQSPTSPAFAWHDVAVGPDGNVYATDFVGQSGVYKFSPALTPSGLFIPPTGDSSRSAGMTFDTSGHLWVSNWSNNDVFEFNSAGTLLSKITSPLFKLPLGLALGPDGNIYVANFGGGNVLQIVPIVPSGGVVNTFITSPLTPSGPKYLWFSENCTTAAGCGVNPLLALAGAWTFSTDGFAQEGPFFPAGPFASAGQFVASLGTRGGNPIGLLTITNTADENGQIVEREQDAGTYQLFPDCSGGTLTFNLSSRPVTFDFWFTNGGTGIRFVSTTPGMTIRGTASRGTSCTASITNPLQTLVGQWFYSTEGYAPSTNAFSSAGTFVASAGANPPGLLTITNTESQNGQITRLETDSGKYQIFPDCSGGSLWFNLSSRPLTFDFWFTNNGAAIRLVSTTSGTTVYGTADR